MARESAPAQQTISNRNLPQSVDWASYTPKGG